MAIEKMDADTYGSVDYPKKHTGDMEGAPVIDLAGATAWIEGLRYEIMSMGANDSENTEINDIIDRLKEGTITPKEAVIQVESIRHGKLDYH